jgi:uncharacterized protein (DUF4415 family)
LSNFTNASGGSVLPTVEEDATITAAALSDPDAQTLTDAQLGAMVPMKTLRGWQARMDGVLREYVAQQARRSS